MPVCIAREAGDGFSNRVFLRKRPGSFLIRPHPVKNPVCASVFAALLALTGGIAFTACQSADRKSPALGQGRSAAKSIQAAADTILAARAQVNVVTAALRNLVDRPQDVPAQYQIVLAELSVLKADATRVSAAADAMRTEGDRYLADWGREAAALGGADLRNATFERRAEVAARLQEIFQSYQNVKAAYLPFQTRLAEIQAVLGADLSARGLAGARSFVARATEEAEPLKAALDKLAGQFRAVGVSLQPGGR